MFLCGRSKIVILVAAGFAALVLAMAASAQETRIPRIDELTATDCSAELLERTDRYYRGRHFSSEAFLGVAEKYVRKVLEVCPSSSSEVLLSELRTMEEERAEQSFLVGKFYFVQAQKGGNGLRGAWSRFLEILEKYPNYSKTDDVLVLLSETYELDETLDYKVAEDSLQRFIKNSPLSPSRSTAETILQQIKTREMVERIKEGTLQERKN